MNWRRLIVATNFMDNNISSINIGNINYNLKSVPFHATQAEWLSINYIPKQGEIIIYDIDEVYSYLRFKTGDGVTQANELPFSLTTLTEVQIFVNNQIGSAGHLKRVVLEAGQELPTIEEAQIDTIYMRAYDSQLAQDVYEEYMVINGAWEIIGNTKVDLSDYATIDFVENKGYLTQEKFQGTVTQVEAGIGLKITGDQNVNPVVELDEAVVFIFDCGTSTELI